jgi:DNA-binding CsgD family transcriptional regulator
LGATQLLAGATVAELAEHLGITIGTARWTLKNVFDKLGVRNQAELMRVLPHGAAGLKSAEAVDTGVR